VRPGKLHPEGPEKRDGTEHVAELVMLSDNKNIPDGAVRRSGGRSRTHKQADQSNEESFYGVFESLPEGCSAESR
jgi:hypothetical protein